jgi:hypothetical protein
MPHELRRRRFVWLCPAVAATEAPPRIAAVKSPGGSGAGGLT